MEPRDGRALIGLAGLMVAVTFVLAGIGSAASTTPLGISEIADATTLATGCCSEVTAGSATRIVLPGIGRATVTASLDVCGITACYPDGFSGLSVRIVTQSGDTLALEGSGTGSLGTHSGQGTWTVSSESTGRFADTRGTGVYTAAVSGFGSGYPIPSVLAFFLTGSISFR